MSRLGLKERSWKMTVHLKKLVPDDIPELVSIEQECFSDPWSERLLSALLESAFDETWVLRLEDGTAAGYINLRFLAGERELMRIAVRPECRGRGYSRKMMEQMVKSAEEKQVHDMTLEVRAGNLTAINLYKSYGFRKEAVRKNYYHDPDEDAFIMWRRPA